MTTPAQVNAIVGRAVDVLPFALTLAQAPAWLVDGVRGVLAVVRHHLVQAVADSLAAEPLPELFEVRPPSLGAAIEQGLREVGALGVATTEAVVSPLGVATMEPLISPLAHTEPPPPLDTEELPPPDTDPLLNPWPEEEPTAVQVPHPVTPRPEPR